MPHPGTRTIEYRFSSFLRSTPRCMAIQLSSRYLSYPLHSSPPSRIFVIVSPYLFRSALCPPFVPYLPFIKVCPLVISFLLSDHWCCLFACYKSPRRSHDAYIPHLFQGVDYPGTLSLTDRTVIEIELQLSWAPYRMGLGYIGCIVRHNHRHDLWGAGDEGRSPVSFIGNCRSYPGSDPCR